MTRFSSAGRANVPSDELKSFRFQRAFYEAGKRLPERTRALFYAALIDYYFTGSSQICPRTPPICSKASGSAWRWLAQRLFPKAAATG